MSDNKFRYSNEKCPVCNKQFNINDDVVVCPYCGTPHHRECYKINTKCANDDKHDEEFCWEATFITPEEVKPTPENQNTPFSQINNENPLSFGVQFPLIQENPLKKFLPKMEDGIKTEDVAYFVQQDAIKYIKRFFNIKEKKLTWNWAAFFFAPYWFFYRKLYKLGAVFLALFVLITSLSLLPPAEKFSNAFLAQEEKIAEISEEISTEEEYREAVMALSGEMTKLFKENTTGVIILTTQSFASFVISIIIGLNANKWYYNHTKAKIKQIKSENTETDNKATLYKTGSVSYANAFLSVLVEKAIILVIEMILSATIL